jgi:hypothetical protein
VTGKVPRCSTNTFYFCVDILIKASHEMSMCSMSFILYLSKRRENPQDTIQSYFLAQRFGSSIDLQKRGRICEGAFKYANLQGLGGLEARKGNCLSPHSLSIFASRPNSLASYSPWGLKYKVVQGSGPSHIVSLSDCRGFSNFSSRSTTLNA